MKFILKDLKAIISEEFRRIISCPFCHGEELTGQTEPGWCEFVCQDCDAIFSYNTRSQDYDETTNQRILWKK